MYEILHTILKLILNIRLFIHVFHVVVTRAIDCDNAEKFEC